MKFNMLLIDTGCHRDDIPLLPKYTILLSQFYRDIAVIIQRFTPLLMLQAISISYPSP